MGLTHCYKTTNCFIWFLCPESLGKGTKFITLDQVLSKLQLVQRRGPFIAAILDFTITKYGDDQIHVFIRFLDPQNLGKDTKIISLARFIEELWMILWYGGHLGRHLEFHPFCPWTRLSTQVFLLT